MDAKIVIASLPTRSNKAPSLITVEHGCNHDAERCFNCYVFEANKPICDNQFSFPIQTFIYGNEVEDYPVNTLQFNHKIEGVDYEILGKLLSQEYQEIINCLKQSTSIRRGVKKFL